jgi:hypothetical protein
MGARQRQARREREQRIKAYEDRGGPAQGHRGLYAHLDPEIPSGPPSGRPENLRGADRDYPEVWRLACDAAIFVGIAEEALNLLDELDAHPGNRVLVMQRARELRTRLDNLSP